MSNTQENKIAEEDIFRVLEKEYQSYHEHKTFEDGIFANIKSDRINYERLCDDGYANVTEIGNHGFDEIDGTDLFTFSKIDERRRKGIPSFYDFYDSGIVRYKIWTTAEKDMLIHHFNEYGTLLYKSVKGPIYNTKREAGEPVKYNYKLGKIVNYECFEDGKLKTVLVK